MFTSHTSQPSQHSLLQCNAYYKEWNTKFGPTHGRQSDVMTQERRRWSIVSKSARGLYLLDADLKREFRREGVTPTAWIWPDRMSVYLHMNHDSETVYNQRGPGAHEALASGNVPASFRGLPVYTVSFFTIFCCTTSHHVLTQHAPFSTLHSRTRSTPTSTVLQLVSLREVSAKKKI